MATTFYGLHVVGIFNLDSEVEKIEKLKLEVRTKVRYVGINLGFPTTRLPFV